MKNVKIEITAKFGSKFQEQFAQDSLMGMLKSWNNFMDHAHTKNKITIETNDVDIKNLEWFNWEKIKKSD